MEEIRNLLLEEKDNIHSDLKSRLSETTNREHDIGDDIDNSVGEQERELSLLLRDREKLHLEAIEDALQRMETGEYGFCDECGDQISRQRLLDIPLARLCITCQQNEERATGTGNTYSRAPMQGFTIRDD